MSSPDPSGNRPPTPGAGAPGTGSNPATGAVQSAPSGAGAGSGGSPSERDVGIATSRERGTAPATGGRSPQGAGLSKQDQAAGGGIRGSLSPFALMRRLSEDMDRLFGDYGGLGLLPGLGAGRGSHGGLSSFLSGVESPRWVPTVDVFQRGDDLVVHAELPGIKRNDINVEVNDGRLTLSGQREQHSEEDRGDSYRSERTFGSFYRAIPLPEEADADHAQARFEDGVLEITIPIPKRVQPKARKVEVK
jgi:HSP20 family protein